jgi:hypothetical protein
VVTRSVARIACVACAGAALWLAFLTYSQAALAGFPDSHLTDYDKAVDMPLRVFSDAEAGLGLVILAFACAPITARRQAVGLLVCLTALVLVAVFVQVGIPWYFGTRLGLDNGIGG